MCYFTLFFVNLVYLYFFYYFFKPVCRGGDSFQMFMRLTKKFILSLMPGKKKEFLLWQQDQQEFQGDGVLGYLHL